MEKETSAIVSVVIPFVEDMLKSVKEVNTVKDRVTYLILPN
jgi:hypothetical protein